MANAFYNVAKTAWMTGGLDLINDTIKVALIDTDHYTFNTTHTTVADISPDARVAVATLTGKSVVDGVFDADETIVPTVPGGKIEAIVIYKDTGVAETSVLIAYSDQGFGFPLALSGADVTITWDDGPKKIFKL